MLFIIVGKICSGKTTVVKRLLNHGFRKVVTYTTRPRRKNEIDGADYHFISESEFKKKIRHGFFFEYRTYEVATGEIWYYGSAKEDVVNCGGNQKKVIILNPFGVDKIIELKRELPFDYRVIYLKVKDATIRARSRHRGDDKEEIERRIDSDGKDFCCMDLFSQKIIWNDEGTELRDVVNKIIEYAEAERGDG